MEEKKEYYENGNLKASWTEKDKKKEGIYKEYYENGIIKKEQIYKNDKLNGIKKEYYENGNLQKIFNLEDDCYIVGKYKEYYENGIIKKEGQYNYNGVRNGEWKIYDKDGDLDSTAIFNNGSLEKSYDYYKNSLIQENFYYEDKTISNIFVQNKLNSISEYHKNGKIKIYKAPDGSLKDIVTKNSWKSYYPNGNLRFDYEMEGTNFKGQHKDYYENGKIKSECFYALTNDGFSFKTGSEFLYRESGILYQKNIFSQNENQEELYKSINYNENNHIESEIFYKGGVKKAEYQFHNDCTFYREYFENGKLFSFGNMKENYSHRTELYSTGEVAKEIIKENDIESTKYFNKAGNLETKEILKNNILYSESYIDNLEINFKSLKYTFKGQQIKEILSFNNTKKTSYKMIFDKENKLMLFYDNNKEKNLEVISNNKVHSYKENIIGTFNQIILDKLGNDFLKIKSLYNENINNEEMQKSFQKKSTRGRISRGNSENER